jgi:tetratricopeptide (TPR) repeat protein
MNFPRFLAAALTVSIAAGLSAAAPAKSPVERAAADIKAGEYTHAEDLLTPLVGRRGSDAEAFFYMGIVRLAQKRYDEAVEMSERATKEDSTKPEYFSQLGLACSARLTQLDPLAADAMASKMRKAYERALKLDPRDLAALTGLVGFYEHAPEIVGGDLRKAREFAERVRQLDPYQGEIELGRMDAGEKHFADALRHYDAAAKLQPNDLATATASGWTLFALGRKDEARARFEAVLKRDPDYAPAKMGLTETAPQAH